MKLSFIYSILVVLGTLLLCIGVIYYYNVKTEGFQTNSNTTCSNVAANQLTSTSYDDEYKGESGTEQIKMGPETEIESAAYDEYEKENSATLYPESQPATNLTAFKLAGSFGQFDVGTEIPWDYDLQDQDPKDILWGTVHPITSQSIFTKAYTRTLFQSANNFEYDDASGFCYRSALFGNTDFHDPEQAKNIRLAEGLTEFAGEMLIERIIEKGGRLLVQNMDSIGVFGGKYAFQITEAALTAQAQAFQSALMSGKSMKESRAAANTAYQTTKAQLTASKNINAIQSTINAAKEATDALYTKKSLTILENSFKSMFGTKFGSSFGTLARANIEAAEKAAQEAAELATRTTRLSRFLTSASKSVLAISRLTTRTITTAITRMFSKKVLTAILSKAAGMLAAKFATALARTGTIMATLAATGPPGWIIDLYLAAFTVATIVIIPTIFNKFVPYDAVCENFDDFNLKDAITKSSVAGPTGYEILSMIPGYGEILTAFAPYLCTRKSDWKPSLKVAPTSPPYFFDSSISIFFDIDKNGFTINDPEVNDIRRFHHNDPKNPPTGSSFDPPIWVDFAEPIMLNKMAQFYYDTSRRYAQSNSDGSVTFEYISKIYGIIGSSKYSCDIQCELEYITYFPYSGKIVERCKVPNPNDVGQDPTSQTIYHDRRFYFWIDYSKGAPESPSLPKPNSLLNRRQMWKNGDYDSLVNDNMAKYCITGCTNSNGTGLDAVENTVNGSYAGDAMVSLGDPGALYNKPVIDINGSLVERLRILAPGKSDAQLFAEINSTNLLSKYPTLRTDFPNKFPPDGSCNTAQVAMFKTGRGAANARIAEQGSISDSENNPFLYTQIKKSPVSSVWNQRDLTESQKHYSNHFGKPKIYNYTLTQQSETEITGTALQQATTAYLPLKFGFKGMLATAAMEYFSIDQAISCSYTDIQNETGTFIINGNIASTQKYTSRQQMIIDRGPTVDYAPGYTPNITKCSNVPILLVDCANRYSLRRAIKYYHDTNPNKRIKYINDISSRRKTPSRNAMCVYDWHTVSYDPITGIEGTVLTSEKKALTHVINQNDITCTYKPDMSAGQAVFTTNIPNIDITDLSGLYDPILETLPASNPSTNQFKRKSCKNTNGRFIDCNDPIIKTMLVTQFNSQYDGNPMIISRISDIETRTDTTSQEYPICSMKVNYIEQKTQIDFNSDSKIITMRLKPSTTRVTLSDFANIAPDSTYNNTQYTADDLNTCLYDLYIDNYKKAKINVPVPVRGTSFRVPPVSSPKNNNFLPANCTREKYPNEYSKYVDCSGINVISNIVNKFNSTYTDRKILKIFRSSTPTPTAGNPPICDYELEILRNVPNDIGPTYIIQKETMRFTLTPHTTGPEEANDCLYDLLSDTSNIPNSGSSLVSMPAGSAENQPYIWPTTFLDKSINIFNQAVSMYRGFDIAGILNRTSRQAKNITDNVLETVLASKYLGNPPCPGKNCRNTEILQSIINRYNFLSYPPYPTGQYGVVQNRITDVRRAGVIDTLKCQVELIQTVSNYKDFTLEPIKATELVDPDIQYNEKVFMRRYQFDVMNDPTKNDNCAFMISNNFVLSSIINNTMDISQNAVAIQSETTIMNRSDVSILKFDTKLDGNRSDIQDAVKNMYNTTPVPGSSPPRYNNLVSFVRCFNPTPNRIEYLVKVIHSVYSPVFRTWAESPNDGTAAFSIIVATWDEKLAPGAVGSYDINTGDIGSTRPVSIKEFFRPKIKWSNLTGRWIAMQTPIFGNPVDVTDKLPYIYYSDDNAPLPSNSRIVLTT